MIIRWRLTAPATVLDILSVFKDGRQILWFYTSAINCEYIAECSLGSTPASCPMPCRVPGSSPVDWASITLTSVESAGPGVYTAVLYSQAYKRIVVVHEAFLYSGGLQNASVPAGFSGSLWQVEVIPPVVSNSSSQNGGLMGCFAVQSGAPCEAKGDVRMTLPNATVIVTTPPPVIVTTPVPEVYQLRCGDGRLSTQKGEQCDDGNSFKADGCSDTCQLEVGYKCQTNLNPVFKVLAGNSIQVTPPDSICSIYYYCGDGITTLSSGEECDDRNVIGGDGCSDCKVDFGYACTNNAALSVCMLTIVTDQSLFSTADCPTCSFLGRCVYYDRRVYCQCKPGFFQNVTASPPLNPLLSAVDVALRPQTCSDVDECLLGTDDCAFGATCKNIYGSYVCKCPPMTSGDGHERGTGCVDVNECAIVNASSASGFLHDCESNADCVNLFGTYTCTCR